MSSIHIFILNIQQILGSHELKGPRPFLTTPTQKSLNQLLAFLNLYWHAKNQFTPSVHLWDKVWPRPFTPIFEHTHPISFYQLLIFVNLYQHASNQFIPSAHSTNTINFIILLHDWLHPFLTMSTSNIFSHLLICINLYQHTKISSSNHFTLEIKSILESRN